MIGIELGTCVASVAGRNLPSRAWEAFLDCSDSWLPGSHDVTALNYAADVSWLTVPNEFHRRISLYQRTFTRFPSCPHVFAIDQSEQFLVSCSVKLSRDVRLQLLRLLLIN